MWLSWESGLALAIALGFATRVCDHPRLRPFLAEGAIVAALYSLWRLGGRLSILGAEDALARGARIWELERWLRLPNELALQEWMLSNSVLTQTANLYYLYAHVSIMAIFLIWLFVRHRCEYPVWRNTLALLTGASLLIQLVPVAPPRLTPETGMIDSGLAYGQSLYGVFGREIAGQLQALPSVHVAWAALIGWAVWSASSSAWRWVGPLHFTLTSIVVVVTGHHYWIDGLLAIVLLPVTQRAGAKLHALVSSGVSTGQQVENPSDVPVAVEAIA